MKENVDITLVELGLDYKLEKKISLNTNDCSSFLDEIKAVNRMPFSEGDFYFSDDIWDFRPYLRTNISRSKAKLSFIDIPEVFKDDAKFFTLIKLLEMDLKIQSIFENLKEARAFFKYAEQNGCYSIQDINTTLVSNYLSKWDDNAERKEDKKCLLKNLFCYYDLNIKKITTKELIELLKVSDIHKNSSLRQSNKLPDLDGKYFTLLVQMFIKIIDSSDAADDPYKGIACVLLMLSQVGLRIGEILNIRNWSVKPIDINNSRGILYLSYYTWKRENGKYTQTLAKTYVNELFLKGYTTLVDLYEEKRKQLDSDYLYFSSGLTGIDNSPVSPEEFYPESMLFYIYIDKYLPTIDVADNTYPGLSKTKLESVLGPGTAKANVGRTITHPISHQFRVHVCSELYRKGVSLEYIKRFMGHLSSSMEGYYCRPKKGSIQEDGEFSLSIFTKLVKGEIETLGGTPGLKEKIDEFIESGDFNVEKDVDSICEALSATIPIRQKTGGVCIKSSIRECSVDSKTNEFYCAYDVCPNIYHFYYMAYETYQRAVHLYRSININRRNNFLAQAQKEINMLKLLVETRLMPELDMLKHHLEHDGADKIISQYPNLLIVLERYDSICAEATEWKTLML